MKIGAMNHPRQPIVEEIRWMAEMGLDFIDLTLEPPAAAPWQVEIPAVRRALDDHGMGVVGHTAYYLPLGHPFERVRRAAVEEFFRSAEVFSAIGARFMNIHPDSRAPLHDRSFIVEQNSRSLAEIQRMCLPLEITLMVENTPGDFNNSAQLRELLDPLPEIMLHLDLGHTHLAPENTAWGILESLGDRLRHVHLHDNLGGTADLHLPLGAGNLDLSGILQALRRAGYDGTVTLEVFAPDREYLRYSAQKLRRLWEELS